MGHGGAVIFLFLHKSMRKTSIFALSVYSLSHNILALGKENLTAYLLDF